MTLADAVEAAGYGARLSRPEVDEMATRRERWRAELRRRAALLGLWSTRG